MSAKSKIEWTDATWNPITGCTAVSAGCQNCYAKVMAERFPVTHSGDGARRRFSDITFHPDRLDQPLHWKKPRKVFVCSMGDLFHESVKNESIDSVFRVIGQCPQHTFMILTKRAKRMNQYVMSLANGDRATVDRVMGMWGYELFHRHFVNYRLRKPIANLWLGVTCEDQQTALQRIPDLLATPAAKHFVSVEPMLEEINLYQACCSEVTYRQRMFGLSFVEATKLDWVICGAETGPHKRPCKPEWIDSLRQQCSEAGIPFFGKKNSKGEPILPREFPI